MGVFFYVAGFGIFGRHKILCDWALVGPFHVVRGPPRVLPRPLAPSGELGGGRSGPGSPLLGLGLWGRRQGVPGGGCLLPLRGASGVMRSSSPDCPSTGRAVGVRVVGAGVRVWGPCSVPVGAARRGAGPWRSYAGGRAGGGGACAVSPGCAARGGACRAGGRSASFRPSAFPGQATKRASLALCCPWGAWPPIPCGYMGVAYTHNPRVCMPCGAWPPPRIGCRVWWVRVSPRCYWRRSPWMSSHRCCQVCVWSLGVG